MTGTTCLIVKGEPSGQLRIRTLNALWNRFDLIDAEKLTRGIEDRLGIHGVTLEPVRDGWGSVVYRVSGPSIPMIAKVGVFSDAHLPVSDYVYVALLSRGGTQSLLAQPYLLDLSGEVIPYQYLVMECLPGASLLSVCEDGGLLDVEGAVGQMARGLAHLHKSSPAVRGFGPIARDTVDAVLSGSPPAIINGVCAELCEYLKWRYVDRFSRILEYGILSTDEMHRLRDIAFDGAHSEYRPTLIHNDPSPRNFLFENGTLTGIIDGRGRAGCAAEDIASACVFLWEKQGPLGLMNPVSTVRSFLTQYQAACDADLGVPLLFRFVALKSTSRLLTATRLSDRNGRDVNQDLLHTILRGDGCPFLDYA